MLTSDESRGQRALLVVVLAVVFSYLLVAAREPLRLNWGDPWSDANVLTALNYSSKYGFIQTSFTDILDVGPLTAESYRYTHYPPFAEIFYGTIRKIAGGDPLDITVYRIFAIGFAGIGVHAFYRYVRDVWGRELAHWATMLCATNLLWLQFADAMHQSPILFASGWTALAGIPGWVGRSSQLRDEEEREPPARRRFLDTIAIVLGTYICFLTAYDYYFFLPTAGLLTARILGVPLLSKRMIKLAAIIAASGALAIATKAVFVTGALGWHGFLEDVHFQFLERATTKFSPDYRSGFLIILLTRWTAYFSPLVFLVALALIWRTLVQAKKVGLRTTVRAIFVGSEEMHGHPGSILILLAAALPFILIFSELSVEQVLPSQVMVPFYAVACGCCITWIGSQRSELLSFAAIGLFIAWQAIHMSFVPKTFLDRDSTAKITAYLRKNDTSDFVVTNLMSDGPVQYFFERHMHMPAETVSWTPMLYNELASKTETGIIHAVYYEDPKTRLIDKSLWYLLPYKSMWRVFGAPHVFRNEALGVLSEWDGRVLEGLRRSGEEVLVLPGVRVFRLRREEERRLKSTEQLLDSATPATRYIDFGTRESYVHTLSGFRHPENYPTVPGFCWSIGRTRQRTVLTKRGLEFRNNAPPQWESRLLLKVDPTTDQKVRLITWGSIDDQTLSASIDGTTVLPTYNLGKMQRRLEVSFVLPKRVLAEGSPVKEVVFKFRDVADYGGGVAFGIMNIEPIEPIEPINGASDGPPE